MFRENTTHLQTSFFDIERQLSESKRKKIRESEEYSFYQLIFRKIKEENFAVLYSENGSRPNSAVNIMVSAIILAYRKGWTIKEMLEQIDFNLLTRTALGLNRMDDTAFCEATFFNFQNRLLKHFVETGENLLETVFDGLTKEQLKQLKIKTDIQRSDSFMAMSNIRNYGRVQLLVEMLLRLYLVLKEEDKERFKDRLREYTKQTSGQYIYKLERAEIPRELEKLGEIYHKLYEALREGYKEIEIFGIFERVYQEHFTVVENKAVVKKNEELHSGILQSPDDIDATYRKKGKKVGKGQSVNVEATIKEFVKPLNHKGKLRVRGHFKTMIYACSMGISINFGRIHRYLTVNPDLSGLLGLMKTGNRLFFKNLFQVGQKLRNIFRFIFFMVKFHQLPNFEIKYCQVA